MRLLPFMGWTAAVLSECRAGSAHESESYVLTLAPKIFGAGATVKGLLDCGALMRAGLQGAEEAPGASRSRSYVA